MAIRQLLALGDMRAARLAIRRARELTANPEQLEALATLAADHEAFALLDRLIRQRDVHGARELMQKLTMSMAADSPVTRPCKAASGSLNAWMATGETTCFGQPPTSDAVSRL